MDKQKDKYTVRTEHAAHVSAVRQCYLVLPETWQAEFKSDERLPRRTRFDVKELPSQLHVQQTCQDMDLACAAMRIIKR